MLSAVLMITYMKLVERKRHIYIIFVITLIVIIALR